MKNVNKIASINILSTAILQGINFFTIPLFTRMLGTEQYGIYSVFNSWALVLTCIMGLNVGSSLGAGKYEFKEKYYEFRSSILLFGSLISIGIIGIALMFNEIILFFWGYNMTLLVLLLGFSFARFIVNFMQIAFVYEKKAEMNFVVSILLSLSTVVLSFFFITKFTDNDKYLGRIYGTTIPYIIIAIAIWIALYAKDVSWIKKEYCRFGFIMGAPIVFHGLSQNVLSQSDRIMMQNMSISNSEIGIYSLFNTFVAVMTTILTALNNSWCPFYYDDLDTQNLRQLKYRSRNYIELFTVLVIGFLMLSREVSYILASEEYWSGIDVIPVLTLAIYFTFMYQFPVNFEFFCKKSKIIAAGTVCTAIFNIVLNALLIPKWGMYGAAIATAFSYFGLFVAHYMIVNHIKGDKYHLKSVIFIPYFVAVVFAVILFYICSDMVILRWGIGAVVGAFELYKIKRRRSIF